MLWPPRNVCLSIIVTISNISFLLVPFLPQKHTLTKAVFKTWFGSIHIWIPALHVSCQNTGLGFIDNHLLTLLKLCCTKWKKAPKAKKKSAPDITAELCLSVCSDKALDSIESLHVYMTICLALHKVVSW